MVYALIENSTSCLGTCDHHSIVELNLGWGVIMSMLE